MLNLLKNEYAKIFHKKSAYILIFVLFFTIIALPVGSKLSKTFEEDTTYYYSSIDEEIEYARSEGDTTYLSHLLMAKSLGLTSKDALYDPNWKGNALAEAYQIKYYSYDEETGTIDDTVKVDKAVIDGIFNDIIEAIENDNWKEYYKIKIDYIDNYYTTDSETKELVIKQYEKLISNNVSPDTDPWELNTAESLMEYKSLYDTQIKEKEDGYGVNEEDLAYYEKEYLIAKYRLENDLQAVIYENPDENYAYRTDLYVYTGDFYNILRNSVNLFYIIALIGVIIAGTTISSEFSQGTIKFLLINPVKRQKIFWSKFLTVVSYVFILSLATFILELVTCILMFGSSELGTELLVVKDGALVATSGILLIVKFYALAFIESVIAVTVAFMLSSLTRNSAISIAVGILFYTTGSTIGSVAAILSIDPARYTIFSVMDLISVSLGHFQFYGMTIISAVIIIVVHMFLMLLTGHDSFTRKNV